MFIVIHGEDQVKSRGELNKILDQAKASGVFDIVRLDGNNLTLDALMQNLEGGSFFGDHHRLTIIENLHKQKSKTNLKSITEYLAHEEPNLVLWESKDLTATQLKPFQKAKIITAKVSPLIFKLTDALLPHQSLDKILPLLNQACAADSAELVLIMLARQIKMMIQSFDPDYKLPPWQAGKVKQAATGFTIEKLITLHHDLTVIDLQNKTGQLSVNLESELAFWLTRVYS